MGFGDGPREGAGLEQGDAMTGWPHRSIWRYLLLLLVLLLSACVSPLPLHRPTATPVPPSPPPATVSPPPPATGRPSPSAAQEPTPAATATAPTPTFTPTPPPTDLHLTADSLTLYPGPRRYSGDLLSFDVLPYHLGPIDPHEITARVYWQTAGGAEEIAEANVGYVTFDQVPRARMTWTWDTTGLVGEQTIVVWVDPDDQIQEGDEEQGNNVITYTVDLLPRSALPTFEATATWAVTRTDCCMLHYLAGSSAERDLAALAAMAQRAVTHTEERLEARLEEPFEIYFVNRVIGHGGYARDELVLSYLDRCYPGAHLDLTIRHEATHVLDALVLTRWSPALLREGLAVWVTGGHFKPEAIAPRAAALLALDWYIPLEELAESFYPRQHEIGYLEGAALVDYLVQTYGWPAFRDFYVAFDRADYETTVDALDGVLREHFGTGLEGTEQAFLEWLQAHPPRPEHVRDLQVTVYFFDTVRRYQSVYDPAAYFMISWLPDPKVGEERSVEADFIRHPRAPEHIALETMLLAAREAHLAGAFDRAEALLDVINQVVDGGSFEDPMAANYLAVVEAVAAVGYEAQRIELEGSTARVLAIADWPRLEELTLGRTGAGWVVAD